MSEPYRRPLSPVERLWLVADALEQPFSNRLVLEGTGRLDEAAWKEAITRASAVNPGMQVVLRGWLGGTRWEATGPPPPLWVADGSAWDARSPEGAPFLDVPIDPRRGPTTDVTLVRGGSSPRVIVRTHHAITDARGTLLFVEDIFRALRGEPLLGATSPVTDVELAHRLGPPVLARRTDDCLAPTGDVRGDARGELRGSTWRRLTVEGRFHKLLPTLAVAVARAARRHGEGEVRLGIPVDLRIPTEAPRATANLTGIAHLSVPAGATLMDVNAAFMDARERHLAASFIVESEPLRAVPLWLMTAVARSAMKRVRREGRYIATGTLSNLGRVPLDHWQGGGFTATSGWFIAPGTDSHPIFIGISGQTHGLEMVATMPKALASEGRLDALLAELAEAITEH